MKNSTPGIICAEHYSFYTQETRLGILGYEEGGVGRAGRGGSACPVLAAAAGLPLPARQWREVPCPCAVARGHRTCKSLASLPPGHLPASPPPGPALRGLRGGRRGEVLPSLPVARALHLQFPLRGRWTGASPSLPFLQPRTPSSQRISHPPVLSPVPRLKTALAPLERQPPPRGIPGGPRLPSQQSRGSRQNCLFPRLCALRVLVGAY